MKKPFKLDAQHYFKAGARLARTGSYNRGDAARWAIEQTTKSTDARDIMRGFDAETALMTKDGDRRGKPLGK